MSSLTANAIADLRALAVEKAVARTGLFQSLLQESVDHVSIVPSDFSKKVNGLVMGNFGCYEPKVKELIKEIASASNISTIGLFPEELSSKKIRYPIGAVVTMVTQEVVSRSSTDEEGNPISVEEVVGFPIGEVVLVGKGKYNYTKDGYTTIRLPQSNFTDIRPATVEEITALMGSIIQTLDDACKVLKRYDVESNYTPKVTEPQVAE